MTDNPISCRMRTPDGMVSTDPVLYSGDRDAFLSEFWATFGRDPLWKERMSKWTALDQLILFTADKVGEKQIHDRVAVFTIAEVRMAEP